MMDDDPIAIALRCDAKLLLDQAPAPDVAAVWHIVQRERAQRIQRIINVCGWSLRAAVAVIFAGVAFFAPQALVVFAIPLALVGWLSRGICSPAFTVSRAASPETAARGNADSFT